MGRDDDAEFEDLAARAQEPDPLVRVVEIVEAATMVEFEVPLDASPHPEATLFSVISEYLEHSGVRRAVIGLNIVYQLNGGASTLIAGLILSSDPVEE